MSEFALRARNGVAVCLRSLENGQLRLIFDDVVAESERWPQSWQSNVFFTQNDYDAQQLCSMRLSETQFAQIGVAVVARLLALNNLVPAE